MNILFWLISALFASLWISNRKKAITLSTLPNTIYILLWPLSGFFIIWTIIYFSWVNMSIYSDYGIIWLIWIIILLDIVANFLEMDVYKKTKLSEILPYTNLDKLFIVLIWFFLFYWTKNSTSITTLLITLLTIIIIAGFSIDFKKFKIPKTIISYSLVMLCRGISVLIVWYIFIKYTTIDYLSINMIFSFIWYLIIALILKNSFNSLFKQSKEFYKSRLISLILGWWWFIIWLYIVKEAWVLIATLISFVWLIFNILAMKFILNDTPEKKQVILAWLVTLLIWVWYIFK